MSHELDPATNAEQSFELDRLPTVPDAPRTVGPALAMATGLVLIGAGTAVAAALALGGAPFDGWASTAMKLGLTPGVTIVGGAVSLAVGIATTGLSNLLRRTIDTLDLASDPVPLLERNEDRLVRMEGSLGQTEQRLHMEVRNAATQLAERFSHFEVSAATARANAGGEAATPDDAVWRLAASMDQIRAQLDQRLDQQLASFEGQLTSEFARASAAHREALESAVDRLSTPAPTTTEPSAVEGDPSHDVTPTPVVEGETGSNLEEIESLAPTAPEEAALEPSTGSLEDSLGVFDQLDENGRPKAPIPSPKDVDAPAAPTEPMPDIYGNRGV